MKPETAAKLASARNRFANQLTADGMESQDSADMKAMLQGIDKLLDPPREPKRKKEKELKSEAFQIEREVVIPKNDREQIKVARVICHAMEFIDLRLWYRERATGVFLPTRKGLTVEIGKRDELITALQAISD
jgi:hypothetical protein